MEKFDKVKISIKGCAKTYPDGTKGLKTTSLEIQPGEIIALLGPSGCGKTTLLRMVAGLEEADEGSQILFGNQDVTALPIEKRNVGMVFQHYALFPQMTVEANIAYGLKIQKLPESVIKEKVADLVQLMSLQGLEKKKPSELSGGQKQRVALARAVAIHPQVLLLDEPLAALDAKLKETLRDELGILLRRLGITAIYVTHDQQEALALADRLAVMHKGEIVQVGTGECLYKQPAHPVVAEFLGKANKLLRSEEDAKDNILRLGGLVIQCPEELRHSRYLLLRPDSVMLSSDIEGAKECAKIEKRIFLGDKVQLILRLSDGQYINAEVHVGDAFDEGQIVNIQVDGKRLLMAVQEN